MNVTPIQTSHCPHCGAQVNATASNEGLPEPGDIGLCVYCGGWQVMTTDYGLRQPTPEEKDELDSDPGYRQIRLEWFNLWRDK